MGLKSSLSALLGVLNIRAHYIIHCGTNDFAGWLAAIGWKQSHACDIAVAVCMLVSACLAVEYILLGRGMGLAEARYTAGILIQDYF